MWGLNWDLAQHVQLNPGPIPRLPAREEAECGGEEKPRGDEREEQKDEPPQIRGGRRGGQVEVGEDDAGEVVEDDAGEVGRREYHDKGLDRLVAQETEERRQDLGAAFGKAERQRRLLPDGIHRPCEVSNGVGLAGR